MSHSSFGSAFVLLFLTLDPFGNIPFFVAILRCLPPERRLPVALREILIAYVVLLGFIWMGHGLLAIMGLSEPALAVAGGVILFLIAIKMIFSSASEIFGGEQGAASAVEPLVFPLAIPLLAGPSALATVLILAASQPALQSTWTLALTGAMTITGVILLLSSKVVHWVGDSVMQALEKLMGLLLSAIAANLMLGGLHQWLNH